MLLSDPSLYKIGLKNKCFGRFLFWRWYLYATWQSFAILWFSLEVLDYTTSFGIHLTDIFKKDPDLSSGVIQGSSWIDGTYILQAIIILVTVKLFVSTTTHTIWSVLIQLAGIALFYAYLAYAAANPFPLSQLLGVARPLVAFLQNYLLLSITAFAFICVDVGMWHLDE